MKEDGTSRARGTTFPLELYFRYTAFFPSHRHRAAACAHRCTTLHHPAAPPQGPGDTPPPCHVCFVLLRGGKSENVSRENDATVLVRVAIVTCDCIVTCHIVNCDSDSLIASSALLTGQLVSRRALQAALGTLREEQRVSGLTAQHRRGDHPIRAGARGLYGGLSALVASCTARVCTGAHAYTALLVELRCSGVT